MGEKSNASPLLDAAELALASFNALFERPGADGKRLLGDFPSKEFLEALRSLLLAVREEKGEGVAERSEKRLGSTADSIDYINELTRLCDKHPLTTLLTPCLFKALEEESDLHMLSHAKTFSDSLGTLFKEYFEQTPQKDGSRLMPASKGLAFTQSLFTKPADAKNLREVAARQIFTDTFSSSRSFRHINGEFHPVELGHILKPEEFFGYCDSRAHFQESFKAFADGHSNFPLLITSLPGLGKTQFTISYTLSFPELTLILPEPSDLERPLENLIRNLAHRPRHKFVLFFDDIDTRKMDWYYFRTNVGGTFSLPSNIIIAIASNYMFPANISSRGTALSFPMFDEIRCQEMVSDFLRSLGMKDPSSELVSVIAAEYVEEFGQRRFEELSPRTLVRYLRRYKDDAEKRMKMLEISKGDVISRPDAQAFYETNVKLLKALYGEEAIEELRKRQLEGVNP